MNNKNTAADSGLIVPIEVHAFCVGTIDQNDHTGTSTFAGATTEFSNQIGDYNAFLGSNISRPYSEAPWQQMDAGIHLHWAIPEALSKGNHNDNTGSIDFLAVCNRWMVNRIIIEENGNLIRKSWVIESDVLNYENNGELKCLTLPVKTSSQSEQDFMFVGNKEEYSGSWKDPDTKNFSTLTGRELSVIANGDIDFAAFYPNCRNVFGLHDTLVDYKMPTSGSVNIMYQVCGWYSHSNNDPLYGGLNLKEIEKAYQWTLKDPSDLTLDYTLYQGLAQQIVWDPNTKYVVDQKNQQPLSANLSVGNNPQEAFSALFTKEEDSGNSFFENLMNAFQNGLINTLKQPDANQLAIILENLHQKQYSSSDSGTRYTIVSESKENKEYPMDVLPLNISDRLNALNLQQEQLDFYNQYLDRFKWQLFSDWYRLIKSAKDNPTITNELSAIILEKVKDGGTWAKIMDAQKKTATTFDTLYNELKKTVASLPNNANLTATASERFWQPNQPVIVLFGDDINNHDSYHASNGDADAILTCRLSGSLVSEVNVNQTPYSAMDFSAIELPANDEIPYLSIINNTLLESCLLNATIMAKKASVSKADYQSNLTKALNGVSQTMLTFNGVLPVAFAVNWWSENPWKPIFMEWEVAYYPFLNTEKQGDIVDYPSDFFTSDFSVKQDNGAYIDYIGDVNPTTIDFTRTQSYRGKSVLSNGASLGLQRQIETYLEGHTDTVMGAILNDLKSNNYPSQSLGGINDAFLMKDQSMQLLIKATASNPYLPLTQAVADIVGISASEAPFPNGYFNPMRAGYAQISLKLLNRYGQKREVNIQQTICSSSMTTYYQNKVVPGVIYFPPRLAAQNKLIFRWLSASSIPLEEMNIHPASSPVCGWLLPNHLDGSFFIYNSLGKALGTMFLNGNETEIMWQSAPGNSNTINQSVSEVFQYENPQLSALANSLFNAGPSYFKAFWKSIDNAHNFINPKNFAQASNLDILIGRPVAVAQVVIGLEGDGGPSFNQSWQALEQNKIDYDNAYTSIKLPVVIGDLNLINDGLIGYFKLSDTSYDFSTFYSEAADGSDSGIIKPPQDNVLLVPNMKFDPLSSGETKDYQTKLLMLVDPRASVHATTGILPTKEISIPYDQYSNILNTLETTFLTTPIFEGVSGLSIPLPKEEGFQWSWISEQKTDHSISWSVNSEILPVSGQAITAYTPQKLVEGWIKLNPDLLKFQLLNTSGKPVASAGKPNELRLKMVNKKPGPLVFKPGELINEGQSNSGSVFYIHFGKLVQSDDIPKLTISSVDWVFKALNDDKYQNYWVATPSKDVTLEENKDIEFTLKNVIVSKIEGQANLYFDYYGIDGLNDGVTANIILISSE